LDVNMFGVADPGAVSRKSNKVEPRVGVLYTSMNPPPPRPDAKPRKKRRRKT